MVFSSGSPSTLIHPFSSLLGILPISVSFDLCYLLMYWSSSLRARRPCYWLQVNLLSDLSPLGRFLAHTFVSLLLKFPLYYSFPIVAVTSYHKSVALGLEVRSLEWTHGLPSLQRPLPFPASRGPLHPWMAPSSVFKVGFIASSSLSLSFYHHIVFSDSNPSILPLRRTLVITVILPG